MKHCIMKYLQSTEPSVGNKTARQLDPSIKVSFAKTWVIYRLHCFQLYGAESPLITLFGRICAARTLLILSIVKGRTTPYLFHS